jgi:hypothetical protein
MIPLRDGRRIRTYTEDELYKLYEQVGGPKNNTVPREPVEHNTHPNVAISLGLGLGKLDSIADMSAGAAEIPRGIAEASDIEPLLGDYAEGYEYRGKLGDTVPQLGVVDLFVCTETLEHLDDPFEDLKLIREHCEHLLVTTPIDEPEDEESWGHMWVWSKSDVDMLLTEAGFETLAFVLLDMRPLWYDHCAFGMWICR